LWRHYFQNTDALIFVVDSNDRERIPEIAEEMNKVLREDEVRDAALLVFANKQVCFPPHSPIVTSLGLTYSNKHKPGSAQCCISF